MRKLRTFYWKVTEFLNDNKIPCLQGLDVIVIIELYRRVKQTVYLYNKNWLFMQKPVRMWHAYIKHRTF